MALELWIPETAQEAARVCNVCGTRFPRRQRLAWEQHVVKCIKRNPEAAEQHAHERDDNYLTGIADKEAHEYVRRHGRL